MVNAEDLLPPSVVRLVGDKLYEKRKVAALEVEQIVKKLAAANDQRTIWNIIDRLISEFAFSQQANHRKGALLCLAAATVGLGEPTEAHLRQIVPPVLHSFTDQDSRVRYYACEALYNIAKVARETFISFFNEVFDAMFRLCADSETNVQNAVQFLDNLVKDIVTGNPQAFNIEAFIPKLREYLRVQNPNKRQFLISWITALDSVPDLDMLVYLPQFLDGLMNMLSDPSREIRAAAESSMTEFLMEIHTTRTIDFNGLSRILVDKSYSQDEATRLTAMRWLKNFVEMGSTQLVEQYPFILGAVLTNISTSSREVQQASADTNAGLLSLPDTAWATVDTAAILSSLGRELKSEQEPTRLEALKWVNFLLHRVQVQVLEQLPALLPALLDSLSAGSEPVVVAALGVLAAIAACPHQFRPVLISLLDRFRGETGTQLLQRGGALVIRRLCGHMGSEKVFTELSQILDEEEDLSFASTMVQALNLILLTSPEVRELRDQLREAGASPPGAALFASLYPCWTHSTGAVLSLCFLAQAYDHAFDMIQCFRSLPMGAEVLLQMDRLVTLLETPCFTFLRLQLLQPRRHPALLRAMYSLLMLLPQSNAWRTLNTRMQSIPIFALMQLDLPLGNVAVGVAHASFAGSGNDGSDAEPLGLQADFPALLEVFMARQHRHMLAEERGSSGAPIPPSAPTATSSGGGMAGSEEGTSAPASGGGPPDLSKQQGMQGRSVSRLVSSVGPNATLSGGAIFPSRRSSDGGGTTVEDIKASS
ncbi:hypothetical protein CEUSTIGMA_g6308.t1 [Chlamydomonas eustigma]|uniref:Vacuolar protein 14 C-terminal Fig4-binding domain-containing protein n=1 Tax=Chlamydomonas eustigma TaxID=1157962 RepID=A0A250X7H7_9CHLO|nr:hypothetical protein CEUSTIGMA_g6308.t1 [Chlamydomonas eustigma]|eukprot:GAX78869.1 hypothetical protein CEUSTIGMA_g6308.t1 [Chlamydomonas eustigma]